MKTGRKEKWELKKLCLEQKVHAVKDGELLRYECSLNHSAFKSDKEIKERYFILTIF